MLDNVKIDDLIFIDIETVPKVSDIAHLDEYERTLWEEKRGRHRAEDETPESFYFNNCSIFAEFGKIVCISIGHVCQDGMFQGFELKSFAGDDEKLLLKNFSEFIRQRFA